MYPYLFGNEHLPMYGIMFMIGIVAALLYSFLVASKNSKAKKEDLLYGACFALVGGILGAKLLSILTSIDIIIEYHIPFIDVIKNGFVFYGGLLGGALGYFIYAKVYKISYFDLTDNAVQSLPLGHCFGRIGCFCAGCCFGKETNSILGVVFTHPADPHCPVGVKVLPTQLFESAFCLLLFFTILIVSRKFKNLKSGILTLIYLLSYGTFRFILEFFRGDEARRSFLFFSTSQWISLLLILFALGVIAFNFYKSKHKNDDQIKHAV